MPTCPSHPQVISPCADDTLPVANVVSVSGDISFDEEGSLVLTEGQIEAEIEFGFQKENSDYVFEYLYVKSADDNAAALLVVPREQTTKKFVVQFSGAPVSAESTLHWRVKIPDGLHACPSLQNGPKYAIIRPQQRGTQAFPQDQEFVIVTFAEPEADADYDFLALWIENQDTELPQAFPAPIVVSRTVNGFRVDFGSHPVLDGYTLHWKIG